MEYDFDFSNLYDATTDEEYEEIWDLLPHLAEPNLR